MNLCQRCRAREADRFVIVSKHSNYYWCETCAETGAIMIACDTVDCSSFLRIADTPENRVIMKFLITDAGWLVGRFMICLECCT